MEKLHECVCIYVIMKTMCPPGYNHNGFVITHALGHMMYIMGLECISCPKHCIKLSVFGVILVPISSVRTKYGAIWSISPYSVRMRENRGQNNSEYGHFSWREAHYAGNWENTLFSWLHMQRAHLTSIRFAQSLCRRSLMNTCIYEMSIEIYQRNI